MHGDHLQLSDAFTPANRRGRPTVTPPEMSVGPSCFDERSDLLTGGRLTSAMCPAPP